MIKPSRSKQYKLPDRFVTIPPVVSLKSKKLKYTDILVYTALKSFNSQYSDINWYNPNKPYKDGCFPSFETISKQAGLAKATVVSAIKRLEAASFISVTRSDKVKVANHYWFPELSETYTIPFKLFRADDLSANEKSMLICIRQFYIGEELTCMFTEVISDIAKHLGLTYRTVHAQYQTLVQKGYVIDKKETYKKDYQRRVVQLSNKLNWIFKAEPEVDYANFKIVFK